MNIYADKRARLMRAAKKCLDCGAPATPARLFRGERNTLYCDGCRAHRRLMARLDYAERVKP